MLRCAAATRAVPPLSTTTTLTQPEQVTDVTVVMAARIACALALSSVALALLPTIVPAAVAAAVAGGSSISSSAQQQLGLLSVLSAALVLLSPLPPAVMEFTRSFRLNETVAGACRDGSIVTAGPLLLLLVSAVGVLGLLPPLLPLPQVTAAGDWAAAAAAAGADAAGAYVRRRSCLLTENQLLTDPERHVPAGSSHVFADSFSFSFFLFLSLSFSVFAQILHMRAEDSHCLCVLAHNSQVLPPFLLPACCCWQRQ